MTKHGAPDWYKYRRDSVTYPVDDLAELAARLWSIVTFDRRGDVIALDSFSQGINKWERTTAGANAEITTSPTTARTGGYSARLITGAAVNGYARLYRLMPYPSLNRLGIEVSFAIHTLLYRIGFGLGLYDGTNYHLAEVLYYPKGNVLRILNAAGGTTVIDPVVKLYPKPEAFHTIKLVADFNAQMYVRCILNATEYDLAAHAYNVTPSGTDPYLVAIIETLTDVATNYTSYVDDVIVTQDEP